MLLADGGSWWLVVVSGWLVVARGGVDVPRLTRLNPSSATMFCFHCDMSCRRGLYDQFFSSRAAGTLQAGKLWARTAFQAPGYGKRKGGRATGTLSCFAVNFVDSE